MRENLELRHSELKKLEKLAVALSGGLDSSFLFVEAAEALGMPLKNIKDGEFYDRTLINNLLRWISSTKGMRAVEEGGKYTATDLGLFKYLVMWSSMERLVARSVDIYRELYRYGTINAWYDKDRIRIEFRDKNRIPEDCAAWKGAMEGFLRLTHTKGRVEEKECVHDGADRCLYEILLE